MLRRITTILLIFSLFTITAQAQKWKSDGKGLEYYFINDAPGNKKAEVGNEAYLHIITKINDSVLFNSVTLNNNEPIVLTVTAPQFGGDLQAGLPLLSAGDKAMFRTRVDSIFRNKGQMPPNAKSGDYITFEINMLTIKTPAELKEEQDNLVISQEDEIIKYLNTHNLKGLRTESGLYYVIKKQGSGPKAQVGQEISMNYTGSLLDGTKFDSNTETEFGHVQPFVFPLGQNRVIKGWDEGILNFNKGTQAILLIPSRLAYGTKSIPGNPKNPKGIPANSVLIFDVEVVDLPEPYDPKKEDAQIVKYLSDNKIKATKTASGLYYTITQKGSGEKAQVGKTAVMNYKGYLLDGTVFDSNMDELFGHKSPFEFPLGQGRVIKGWDEGVALLNVGSKARFFIPSTLAYGERAMPATAQNPKGIPKNSILIFDVELIETK